MGRRAEYFSKFVFILLFYCFLVVIGIVFGRKLVDTEYEEFLPDFSEKIYKKAVVDMMLSCKKEGRFVLVHEGKEYITICEVPTVIEE